MKTRHVVMGIALAVAAGLVLFDSGERAVGASMPRARNASANSDAHDAPPASPVPAQLPILALHRRGAEDGADEFVDNGNDAFAMRSWTPPPEPLPPEPPPPVPPAPVAPPLPFTYIGKTLGEGRWEVYLAHGERTYILHDHDVLDGTYRVQSINPPLMVLTYLPLNQTQQLTIGAFN